MGDSAGIPVDRYTLFSEIESGGMATVYLGRRVGPHGFRRLLALKRIRPNLAEDPQLLATFREEARLSALMRHPNLIQVYDCVESEGLPCLVMDLVHGRMLSRIAQRGARSGQPLTLAMSTGVVAQALDGLAFAHGLLGADGAPLHLVHRDISPQNILVGVDGRARLFDFGISQASDQDPCQQAGVLAGKHAYISPEQCSGQCLDARSDVFGVGVILYELITQTRLFKRDSAVLTLKAVTTDEIPAPSTRNPDVPERLEAIVMKALARPPEERYQTAQAMADDLYEWLFSCGQPWGSRTMARYLEDIFGEELAAERAEHQRLLMLPPSDHEQRSLASEPPPAGGAGVAPLEPAAPERSPSRPAMTPAEVARAETGPVLIAEGGIPQSRPLTGDLPDIQLPEGNDEETRAIDPQPRAVEPQPISWLRSLLVGAGLALVMVILAALARSFIPV